MSIISDILYFPTTVETTRGPHHESLLRSYQILQHVKEMLKRGDSAKTILELVEYIEQQPANQ